METFIAFLSLGLFLAFIVGMVRPSLVKVSNRKIACAVYLGGCFAVGIAGSIIYPTAKPLTAQKDNKHQNEDLSTTERFAYAEKTLKEYGNETKESRHEIVENFLKFKKIKEDYNRDFYACLSEYTYTKSEDLKLGDVLNWCYGDYQKDPNSLSNKTDLDIFRSKFSGWDGSYRPLEKLIKDNMHDYSSYKHIATTYHLILNKEPYAVVKTTFNGKDEHGNIVKQTIASRVDVKTGDIVEIINNQ